MAKYSEYELLQALQALNKGRSLRKVAQDWGIPKSTLQHRREGVQPRAVAFESLQRLSKTQEDRLSDWSLRKLL